MTLREKYDALLKDLYEERAYFGERWAFYYDKHIAELEAAIEERYGDHNIYARPLKPLWAPGSIGAPVDGEVPGDHENRHNPGSNEPGVEGAD